MGVLSLDSFKFYIKDNIIQMDTPTYGSYPEIIYTTEVSSKEFTRLTFNSTTERSLNLYDKDDNKVTPLCFAILNNVPPEVIACLINMVKQNIDQQKDRDTKEHLLSKFFASCKGKSPLQYGCIAMNFSAIDVLTGKEIEYLTKDINGNLITENKAVLNQRGDDLIIFDDPVSNKVTSSILLKDFTSNDLIEASLLSSGSDIVELIISTMGNIVQSKINSIINNYRNKYLTESEYIVNIEREITNYRNFLNTSIESEIPSTTPLIATCLSQNYSSIQLLLNTKMIFKDIEIKDKNTATSIAKNVLHDDDLSAILDAYDDSMIGYPLPSTFVKPSIQGICSNKAYNLIYSLDHYAFGLSKAEKEFIRTLATTGLLDRNSLPYDLRP